MKLVQRDRKIYLPLDAVTPFKGYDSVTQPVVMDPTMSPSLKNMEFFDGVGSKRTGNLLLGDAVDGVLMALEEFVTAGGSSIFFAATTTREYKYDSTNDEWDEITEGFGTVVDIVDATTKKISITGNVASQYVAGDSITVDGATNGANNDTFTVSTSTWNSPNTDIVVTEGTLVTETPPAACRARKQRTGVETDAVYLLQGQDENDTDIFLTNGKDLLRKWTGSGNTVVMDPGTEITFPGLVHCHTFAILDQYMFYGNVLTASDSQRGVAYSDTNDWTDFSTGNSGAKVFPDAKTPLLRLLKLGNYIISYFKSSIHLITHIGGVLLFSYEKLSSDIGPVSGRAIVDLGPVHIFMGKDNFYAYDGTGFVVPVGEDMISNRLKRELSEANASLAWGFVDKQQSLVYWIVPVSATSQVVFRMRYSLYDIRNPEWTVFEYANRVTCMGLLSTTSDLAWEDVDSNLSWADAGTVATSWRGAASQSGFPVPVLGCTTATYITSSLASTDAGTSIDAFYDSKDFIVPQDFLSSRGRWLEIEVDLKGSSIDVMYSTDEGVSWTFAKYSVGGGDADGVALTSVWESYKFFLDVVSPRLRVRLANPDSGLFSCRWRRVWVRPGGVR